MAVVVVAKSPVDTEVLVKVLLGRRVEGSLGSCGRGDISREVPRHGSQIEVVLCPNVVVVGVLQSCVLHVEEWRVVGVDIFETP